MTLLFRHLSDDADVHDSAKGIYWLKRSADNGNDYAAYRLGKEYLSGKNTIKDDRPPTNKQEQLIAKLVKDFPDAKELMEYEDYTAHPTKATASALITLTLESNWDRLSSMDGYAKYIALRPRAERLGEHGLFGDDDDVDLSRVMDELDHYTGNVWTHIISLHREDAERLGYNHAEAWRTLLRTHRNDIAVAMKIPPEDFRWYAAFHDEGNHPHVHMMAWSAKQNQAYLSVEGIKKIKSTLTNQIFRQDLLHFDALFIPANYKEVGLVANQARNMGITQQLIGPDAWQVDDLFALAADAMEGGYFVSGTDITSDALKAFSEKFHEKFDYYPSEIGTNAFFATDAFLMMKNAIETAGEANSEKIRDALENTKELQCLTSKITVMPQNHNPLRSATIFTIKDAAFVRVTDFELQSN